MQKMIIKGEIIVKINTPKKISNNLLTFIAEVISISKLYVKVKYVNL